MNNWLLALKEWNKAQPKYTVPKKGTTGYNAVMKIKKQLDGKKGGAYVANSGPDPNVLGTKIIRGIQTVQSNPVYQAFTSVGMPSTSGPTKINDKVIGAVSDSVGRVGNQLLENSVKIIQNRRRRR